MWLYKTTFVVISVTTIVVTMKKRMKISKLEMEVMQPLWELEQGTVREVYDKLPEDQRPEYTTVQTIMNRLLDKGAVEKDGKSGKAFIFKPTVTKKTTLGNLLEELVDLFGGSAEPVMAHLVESGKLNLKDIKAMEDRLKELKGEE